jgi:hypothetical protein
MATITVTHAKVSSGTVDAGAEVDLHDWNDTHTVSGLENVDNTSDLNKPISTATQSALDLKAAKATTLTAGAGLTGGGDLSANLSFVVGAGTGITVNADDVALNISGLTEDTAPDAAADFVATYDTSATTHKKVKLSKLGGVTSIAGNTGAFTLANGIDNSGNQIQLTAARRTLPTTQVFTSGSGTYTTPSNCLWIEVELSGAGGGGAGSGTSPGNGSAGGNTSFSTLTGNGGAGASANNGGIGGSASGGDVNLSGGDGSNGSGLTVSRGGDGGIGYFGGAGAGGAEGAGPGIAGKANTGSGGGGGGVNTTVNGGGGGAAGGYARKIINSPSATYSYVVGAAGTAGTAGTSGAAGAAGGSGIIIVKEYYNS